MSTKMRRKTRKMSSFVLYYIFSRWARLMQKGPRQDESLANILKNVSKVLRYSLMSEEELLVGQ